MRAERFPRGATAAAFGSLFIAPYNAYRTVRIRDLAFKLKGVDPRETVLLPITLRREQGVAEIRFWHRTKYLGTQRARLEDFDGVRF